MGGGFYSPADHQVLRGRRRPGKGCQGDGVDGSEFGGIFEIDTFDDIAVLDAIFGSDILMLPVIILMNSIPVLRFIPLQELAALTFIIDKEQDFCLLNSLEIFS